MFYSFKIKITEDSTDYHKSCFQKINLKLKFYGKKKFLIKKKNIFGISNFFISFQVLKISCLGFRKEKDF